MAKVKHKKLDVMGSESFYVWYHLCESVMHYLWEDISSLST